MLDGMRQAYEKILGNWAGWKVLSWMVAGVLFARVHSLFSSTKRMIRAETVTTFVSAAVAGGMKNELQNQPIIIEL